VKKKRFTGIQMNRSRRKLAIIFSTLQEGKVYAASGPRVEVPEAYVMFRIKDGKAIRIPDE